MLTVYHSNDLEILKALVVHLMGSTPLRDPFAREHLLVQSTGMGQWLRQQLAQEFGVVALVDTQLPARFIWDIYQAVLPGLSERSAFGKAAMSWKLMALLPELMDQADFAPLKAYLADDKDARKGFQLASRIADLFDQYLVYRSDWILDWEAGGALGAESQPWQPLLWRALVKRVQEQAAQPGAPLCPEHRASLNARAIQALKSSQPFNLPERVFVFGISALPPQYLELLAALGQRIPVHLMVSNPCEGFWSDLRDRRYQLKYGGDDEPLNLGNPLLASFGKLGRDYLSQLEELSERHLDGVGEVHGFVEPATKPLIGRLQADLLALIDRSEEPGRLENLGDSQTKTPLDPLDRSIQLHSCHSPMREVEVLQDQLLALFAENPELTPKDVIVMMPDVNQYAPAIQAVFASTAGERRIPVAISDRSARAEQPLLDAFLRLLELPKLRGTATELLELLETPAILRRFSLDQADFDQLYQWVMAVNVRWGLDGDSKKRFELPAAHQNSWQFGLERLLAGYACAPEGPLLGQISPYTEIEGLAAEPVGQLAAFLAALRDWSAELAEDANGELWQQRLHRLAETFFLADSDEEVAQAQLDRTIDQLADELACNDYRAPLPLEVVSDWLTQQLDGDLSSSRFLAGRVNFCTLMPMRAIPFKVVCLLGMNDGVYPRSIAPLGFDLIAANPGRRGDRSRREDDRYLFLEALLAARQYFYLSFIGRSVQDNSERSPSVLIAELLEYVQYSFVLPGDEPLSCDQSAEQLYQHLLCEHPLQPFSPRYFNGVEDKLFSYANEWREALTAEEPVWPKESLPIQSAAELELPDLIRCWRHPSRYFFNERLKVYFDPAADAVQDIEPFTLDGLNAYQVKERWLDALAHGRGELVPADLRAEGLLPAGAFGALSLDALESAVAAFWQQQLEAPLSRPLEAQEIDLNLCGVQLQGWVQGCCDLGAGQQGPLRYRASKAISGKQLQAAWLEHLALSAMGRPLFTRIVSLGNTQTFMPLAQAQAQEELSLWLDLWQQSLSGPIAYLPDTAFALCSGDEEQRWKKAHETLVGSFHFEGAWGQCPYLQRSWESAEALLEQMQVVAEPLWTGLLAQLQESGDE